MRVCGRFPNSPARATTVLGLEHFRATARRRGLGAFVCDGIDRETVEGRGACQDHLRECSRRALDSKSEKARTMIGALSEPLELDGNEACAQIDACVTSHANWLVCTWALAA